MILLACTLPPELRRCGRQPSSDGCITCKHCVYLDLDRLEKK